MRMREFMKIVEWGEQMQSPTFGRKGAAQAAPNEPADPAMRQQLANARKYRTADEYADDNNSIYMMNSDPPHLKMRHDDERNRLRQQWLNWQAQGYLPPA